MKTVLITGSSRGIGAAMARQFANNGWQVAIHYHQNREKAECLARDLPACACFGADLSVNTEAKMLIDKVTTQLGEIDVLINNAGISRWGTLDEMTDQDFEALVQTNLGAMFRCSRALYRHFAGRGGCIINVSSMWGQVGASCEVLYSMTKGGVIAFTKALAKELAPSGVRVNAICPGVIDTDIMASFRDEDLAALVEETPLGRLGTPEDIARAAYFLASEDASFITGQTLGVNGGFII